MNTWCNYRLILIGCILIASSNLQAADYIAITDANRHEFLALTGSLHLACWQKANMLVKLLNTKTLQKERAKLIDSSKLLRSLQRKISILNRDIRKAKQTHGMLLKHFINLKHRKRRRITQRNEIEAAISFCKTLAYPTPSVDLSSQSSSTAESSLSSDSQSSLSNGYSNSSLSSQLSSANSSQVISSGSTSSSGPSSSSASSISPGSWQPPIGIPRPSFGIEESVETFYGSDGYYTHYIDNSKPQATDINNPKGSPTLPRITVPSVLPAGSVVYVAAGTYSNSAMDAIRANGTSAAPVFLRSNPSSPATITIETSFSGSYFIIENLRFDGSSAQVNILGPSDHIALRDSEVQNADGNGAGVCVVGSWNADSDTIVQDIVLYRNRLHDLGDMAATTDQDHHGVVIGHHAHHVWMVDNEIFNASGSGLQVNSGFLDQTGDRPAHHIFVGRNHIHTVRQSGLTIKKARDIVFSQNHVHDVIDTTWSTGKALGFQYAPYNIWFIYNLLHDTTWGINGPSNDGGVGGSVYFVGNVIFDCDTGMIFWNNEQVAHIVANTITRVNVGIDYDNGPAMHLSNNIFSDISDRAVIVLGRSGATAAASSTTHDLFNATQGLEWGGVVYSSLASFQTATGKGSGNLAADPRFEDPVSSNFELRSDSPARDGGIMPSIYQDYLSYFGESIGFDFRGRARGIDFAHDIGAYEF